MKIVTFTTLYPSQARPTHGLFVEQRLTHLVATGKVASRVIAPVPWFFSRHPRFGDYAKFAATPRCETRAGITIDHPRYLLPPRVGMRVAPYALAWGAQPALRKLRDGGHDFELIDAHYFYPDGVAAAFLAAHFARPLVITARGTDLSYIPSFKRPRRMIQWAAKQAAGVICVCQALKDSLVELGVDGAKISVLRNGVDLVRFAPGDRNAQRRELGWEAPTLLSVGNLYTHKGHDLVIRAMGLLPGYRLKIIGSGPERGSFARLAQTEGVADRVEFLGAIAQTELKQYYGAADALVLASSREGWANVLLEAMACGTPVVASAVGGNPEVVTAAEAGVLMRERTPAALADAVRELAASNITRAATRAYAERFSWDATSEGQIALFQEILASRHP